MMYAQKMEIHSRIFQRHEYQGRLGVSLMPLSIAAPAQQAAAQSSISRIVHAVVSQDPFPLAFGRAIK